MRPKIWVDRKLRLFLRSRRKKTILGIGNVIFLVELGPRVRFEAIFDHRRKSPASGAKETTKMGC